VTSKSGPINTGLADDVAAYLNTGDGPVARWMRSQAVNGHLTIHAPDSVLLIAECRYGSAVGEARSGLKPTKPEATVRLALPPGWIYNGNNKFPVRTAHSHRFPDFILPEEHECIFVHGCYWHGCPRCFPGGVGAARVDNAEALIEEMHMAGWHARVVWECEADKFIAGRSPINTTVENC